MSLFAVVSEDTTKTSATTVVVSKRWQPTHNNHKNNGRECNNGNSNNCTRAIGCNRRGYVTNNKVLRLSKGLVLSRMMGMIDARIQ